MHGSPLLRCIVVTLVVLAAGLPLWRLTHGAPAAVADVNEAQGAGGESKAEPLHMEVDFVQKPVRFEILYLGKTVWHEEPVPSLSQEKTISLIYPKEGVDLEYKVDWPPGTALTAARLSVSRDEAEPVEKTLWGTGRVDDILSFP